MVPDRLFWSGKHVCVTGGTGFLGYQIVKRLLEFGASVRVFALRPRRPHPVQKDARVETIFGDVREPDLLRRAVADCEVVFHAAGLVAVWGPALRRVSEVHTAGLRNLLEAAAPSARVVLTSSVVTVGAGRGPVILDEDTPFNLDGIKIDYVHAKRAAEAIAVDEAGRGRDVVVVNPGYLVGPEDFERSAMGEYCLRYWRGKIPVASPGGLNLVDARDVANGHLLAAERGKSGRRYILGGQNQTIPGLMDVLGEVGGFRPRIDSTLPYWGLAALARCGEARALWTRRPPYPALQHARLNRYYWYYRSDRAIEELGYETRPLSASLQDAYDWFCSFKTVRPRGMSRWLMKASRRSQRAA